MHLLKKNIVWPVCTLCDQSVLFLRFYRSASTQLSLLTTNQILEENHGKKKQNRLYNQQNMRRLISSASFWFQPHRKGQWSIHSDGAKVRESVGGGGGSSAHIHQNNYPIKVTSDVRTHVPHVRRHDWSEVKPCSRWPSSPSGSPLQGKGLLASASQHYKAAFYLSAAANTQQNKEFSLCFQNDVNPVNVWCVLVPRGMSPSDFTYGAIFSKMFGPWMKA